MQIRQLNSTPTKSAEDLLRTSIKNIDDDISTFRKMLTDSNNKYREKTEELESANARYKKKNEHSIKNKQTLTYTYKNYNFSSRINFYFWHMLAQAEKYLEPLLHDKRKKLKDAVKENSNQKIPVTADSKTVAIDAKDEKQIIVAVTNPSDPSKFLAAAKKLKALMPQDHPRQIKFLKTLIQELSFKNGWFHVPFAVLSAAYLATIGAVMWAKTQYDAFDFKAGETSLTRGGAWIALATTTIPAAAGMLIFSVHKIIKLCKSQTAAENELEKLEPKPKKQELSSTAKLKKDGYGTIPTTESPLESIALPTLTTNASAATPKPDVSVAIAPAATSSTATTSTPATSEDEQKNLLTEQRKSRCIIL